MIVSYFQNDVRESYYQNDINFCLEAICRIGELSLITRKDGNLAIYLNPESLNKQVWNICCDDPFLRELLMFLNERDSNARIREFYQDYIKHCQLTEYGLLSCKIYTEGLNLILQGGEKPIDIVKKLMQMLETERPQKNANQIPNSDDKDNYIV